MHTLYDIEAQVSAFVHITPANVNDIKALPKIPYEEGAHYIFDRGYHDYTSLYTINRIGAFFVLRARSNVKMKVRTWSRRLPKGIISDIKGSFSVYKSSREYPEELRKVIVLDPDDGTRYIFFTNNMEASPLLISEFYRNRWSVELFFKWVTPVDKEVLWDIGECSPDPSLLCHNNLLSYSNSTARYETGKEHL